MYNAHRGMAPGPQPGGRLTELLEQVRGEFDAQVGRSAEHEHQRKSRPRAMRCTPMGDGTSCVMAALEVLLVHRG